jgi:hypothetical protein
MAITNKPKLMLCDKKYGKSQLDHLKTQKTQKYPFMKSGCNLFWYLVEMFPISGKSLLGNLH